MSHRIVKSSMTVFADLSANSSWSSAEPMALAQTYSFDSNVATQNLTANDLSDAEGQSTWVDPEPSEKGWTIATDALVLIDDISNPNYDPSGKNYQNKVIQALKEGMYVWVGVKSTIAPGDAPLVGYGQVTAFNQSGSTNEYHTYSFTVTGNGEFISVGGGPSSGIFDTTFDTTFG